MNVRVLVVGLLASVLVIPNAQALVYGHTFLPIRPIFEIARPEYVTMFRDFRDVRKDGHGASFDVAVLGGRTSKTRDMAQYLLPNQHDSIVVGEDVSSYARDWATDINAYNVGILTHPVDSTDVLTPLKFESRVKFHPRQSIIGVGFAYHQRLPRHLWLEVGGPLVRVVNSLGMKEKIMNAGGGNVPEGAFSDFISAMGDCNTKRCYGRMTNKCLKKTRFSHIDARFGYDSYSTAQCLHGWFVGLTIPTGNKPCGKYFFEPIVGNNGHWGSIVGSYGNHELLSDTKGRRFVFSYESVLRYLFENKQRRSFDLKHRPWSRYMVVYNNQDALPEWTPEQAVIGNSDYLDYLVNHSTLCVTVRPHYTLDLAMGVRYEDGGFNAEFGGNVCVRHNEEICLSKGCPCETYGIAALRTWSDADAGSQNPKTRTNSLPNDPIFAIENEPVGNPDVRVSVDGANTPVYRAITRDDFELNSAACPGVMSQIVYGSLGYTWRDTRYPTFLNFGASYEWGHENAAIERWLLWFKFGLAI